MKRAETPRQRAVRESRERIFETAAALLTKHAGMTVLAALIMAGRSEHSVYGIPGAPRPRGLRKGETR